MAKAEPLDAAVSDPNVMGWMQGFPPDDDRIIGYPASDYFSFPKLRWTFCHLREIQATKRVGRGVGPVSPFSEALDPAIDDVTFTPIGATEEMTWKESLDANYTDGMVLSISNSWADFSPLYGPLSPCPGQFLGRPT